MSKRLKPIRANVRGRAIHTCLGCGAKRNAPFEQRFWLITLTDSDDALADQIAPVLATKPPMPPCLQCGTRFPAAVARTRQWWDQWAAVFGPFATMIVLTVANVARVPWQYWLFAALAPLLVMVGFGWVYLVGRRVPSSAGRVGLDGEPCPADPAPARGWAYLAFAIALLVLVAAPLYRYAAQTPLNEECMPMVVAPGTTVRVYLDHNVKSVKGRWGGHGQVIVLDADGLPQPPEFVIKVPPPQQEQIIMLAKNDQTSESPDIHMAITLPDDPALVGKTLRLRLLMTTQYPKSIRGGQYEYVTTRLAEERDLTIVAESVKNTDMIVTGVGSLVGFSFVTLGGGLILLSNRRMRRANPLPQVRIDNIDW